MKKLFTLFLALVAGVGTMFAWDYERVQIGDLYYNLDATNQTAEVTSKPSDNPDGPRRNNYEFSTITIPSSVTYSGDTYSVTSIESYAFSKSLNLTSITIPSTITTIYEGITSGCPNLETIIVEEGNNRYDSRDNCNAIIQTSSNVLISGCKNTVIPYSVTGIFMSAFNECTGLTSITIPSGVTIIFPYAFEYCTDLTSVTCKATTPPTLGMDVFRGLNCATIPLYVPAKSVEAYKAADQWKEFNVQAISEDALPEILTDENALDDKFIIDGVLYIRKDGRVYDINGIIVE